MADEFLGRTQFSVFLIDNTLLLDDSGMVSVVTNDGRVLVVRSFFLCIFFSYF